MQEVLLLQNTWISTSERGRKATQLHPTVYAEKIFQLYTSDTFNPTNCLFGLLLDNPKTQSVYLNKLDVHILKAKSDKNFLIQNLSLLVHKSYVYKFLLL